MIRVKTDEEMLEKETEDKRGWNSRKWKRLDKGEEKNLDFKLITSLCLSFPSKKWKEYHLTSKGCCEDKSINTWEMVSSYVVQDHVRDEVEFILDSRGGADLLLS